jgi:hypothetical protein
MGDPLHSCPVSLARGKIKLLVSLWEALHWEPALNKTHRDRDLGDTFKQISKTCLQGLQGRLFWRQRWQEAPLAFEQMGTGPQHTGKGFTNASFLEVMPGKPWGSSSSLWAPGNICHHFHLCPPSWDLPKPRGCVKCVTTRHFERI